MKIFCVIAKSQSRKAEDNCKKQQTCQGENFFHGKERLGIRCRWENGQRRLMHFTEKEVDTAHEPRHIRSSSELQKHNRSHGVSRLSSQSGKFEHLPLSRADRGAEGESGAVQ